MSARVRRAVPGDDGSVGTIVFVHGFPFDGSMWEPQLNALPAGWRGLAPHLRGFGDTDMKDLPGEVSTGRRIGGRIAREEEPVLTMARLADDMAALIHAESRGPAVVCGLSMGGYVALELWRRHPARIRALVLADTRAAADDDESRENRLRMAQTVRRDGLEAVARAMVPVLLAPGTREAEPAVVAKVRAMITGNQTGTVIAALAGMAARHDNTPELHGITVPTLVLVGEHDEVTPPAEARGMAGAIPGARIEIVEGAGHLPPLERPEAFNRALGTFLQSLD